MNLTEDVKYIKGVGPTRVLLLNKLGIFTLKDLITYYPRTYEDRSKPKYICETWLLSKEISKMLDENSNIKKFQELFDIQSSKNAIDDVLNFVFNLKKCDNYNELPETTRLQKSIKEFLINNGTIYEGYGELKK